MAITLTDRAAQHARKFISAGGCEGLRVAVKKTGCSGYAYVVEPAQAVGDADAVFESNGVRVVIDRESLLFLQGTQLDYTREGLNEGFRFHNPNVKASCGCGESFSV